MPNVVIACPVHDRLVFTGVVVEDDSQLDSLGEQVLHDCPECGHDHIWMPQDAAVSEE